MAQRPTRWRTGRSQIPSSRRKRRPGAGMRWVDWLKLLALLGLILFIGLGEPLSRLDTVLGYFGFR